MTKACGVCKQTLSLEVFGRDVSKHDGRRNVCRQCTNAALRALPTDHPARVAGRERNRARRINPTPGRHQAARLAREAKQAEMDAAGIKHCSKCSRDLPFASFNKNRTRSSGMSDWCSECEGAYQMERYRERSGDPEKRKRDYELAKLRIQKNRRKIKEQLWRAALKRKYGIAADEYDALLAGQDGCCAICKTPDFRGKRPHVDHCHQTGVVRGILCTLCNTGVGYFQDDADRMRSAIEYLNGFYRRILEAA